MSSDLKKIAIALKKKKISLDTFEDYLNLKEKANFEKISRAIKKQGIDLQKYKEHLERSFVHGATLVQEPLNQKEQQKQKILQRIGAKLLGDGKIDLVALNTILKEFTFKEITPRILLQRLIKERILTGDEFLAYEQDSLVLSEKDFLYQMKITDDVLEFSLKLDENTKTFGHYQVLEELARGGMGIVYKAYHPTLCQIFALKVLLSGEDASLHELMRFHREIQVMAKLKHPGIIQIIDSGQEGLEHYFTMEFVNGEPLSRFMRKKMSLRKRVSFMKEVLEALHYAHSQGIIHRDLKPDNIFVSLDEKPKIGDFGLAKDLEMGNVKESQKLTHSQVILGSLKYMSPEQAQGEAQKVDARADIYSAGVCLYKFLTGRLPYQIDGDGHVYKQLYKVIFEEALPPSKFNPEIHEDLEIILLKSLEKAPEKRYQTAQEFSDELDRFLAGVAIKAKPLDSFQKCFRWGKRNRVKVVLTATVALLSFIFVFLFFLFRYNEREEQFTFFYSQAISARKTAESITGTGYQSQSKKIELFIEALNQLSTSLSIKKGNRIAEREKLSLAKELVFHACRLKKYKLAYYVYNEIKELVSIPEKTKREVKLLIEYEENKTQQKNLNILQYWLGKLRTSSLTTTERKEAIFEISKIKEKKVFQRLMSILEESIDYFQEKDELNVNQETVQDEYYRIAITILGRLGNPKACPKLLHALESVALKLESIPKANRPLPELMYMVELAQALGNICQAKDYEKLNEVRNRMGEHSFFWTRTLLAHRKLYQAKNKGLPVSTQEKILKSAKDYLKRGTTKYNERDFDGAIRDYSKAIQIDPYLVSAYNNRGLVKYAKRDFEGAIEDFSQAIRMEPGFVNAYNGRGLAYHGKESFEKAILDFDKTIRFAPKFAEAYNNRGNSKKGKGDYKGALKDYHKAIKLNPKFTGAYYNRGHAYISLKLYDKAIQDYTFTIRLDPQDADLYEGRALAKEMKGDFNGAIQDYNQAIRIKPRSASAYHNRAGAKESKGDHQGALLDFTESIRLSPQFFSYNNRGVTKKALGDYQGALDDFTKALQLNPQYVVAYNNRGAAKKALGDVKGALIDINKAIQIDSKFADAYFSRGVIKQQKKDFVGALQDFSQAILLDPKEPEAFYNRGYLQYLNGEFKEASEDFSQAILLDPKHIRAYLNRAKSKQALTKYQEAIDDYNETIRLAPEEALAFKNRGILRHLLKDEKGAKEDLQQYLSLTRNSSNKNIQKIRQQILKKFPDLKE